MILMNDFQREPEVIRLAMREAIGKVLDSGWYVLGPEVNAFEKSWAAKCGTSYAVGVANGLDAIEIAVRTLKVGPGDEVITTSMTAFATALGIIRSGALPVLADIEPGTALLSIESVRRCLSSKTRAIVLVHLYGQVRNMDDWISLSAETGIPLIEDCAQAHLAEWRGRKAGGFGSAGAFSFYPTKNLGAVGDGGMLTTNQIEIFDQAKRMRNYGQTDRYHHIEFGFNSRLDEIQAGLLTVRLEWLGEFTKLRQKIAATYFQAINNPYVSLMDFPEFPEAHVYHLFVVCSIFRDELQKYLQVNGIQSLIHYPIPLHLQPPARNFSRDPKGLAVTEQHASQCLSIPCHPQMSDDEVMKVVAVVNAFTPRK
jgi:dTDP-4-amino-4,6-dideoxygalactose transaminase